ncbi:PucR family transcriptional regulator [Paenibacillus sp. strain BS8-2]
MLLNELIESTIMSEAHILAGAGAVDVREVLSVNIMDAPDIVVFLKPGDLLLTNGYVLKDSPEKLIDVIRGMHDKGCAGLAVKTQRFALRIPQEALDEADRLGFPILEMSMIESTLGDIFRESIGILLDNKNKELHYTLTIHKQFADMMMRGGGLTGIIGALASIVSGPVLLLDAKYELLSSSDEMVMGNPESASALERIANAMRSASLPDVPVSLCLPAIKDPAYRQLECHPIFTYRQEGYLLAFSQHYPLQGPKLLALEQATHVIGLELTKRHAVKERSRRYKNDFFSDLIEGFVSTEQEAMHRGARYGFKPDKRALLIVAREDAVAETRPGITGKADNLAERISAERDRHYHLLKREFIKLGVEFVMFAKNDMFGVLLFPGQADWNETELLQRLERMVEDIYGVDKLSYSLGIGSPYAAALDLGLSYREAVRALQGGISMNKRRFVTAYRSLDFSRLLRMLPLDELERFYHEAFKTLLGKGDQEQSDMLRTLRAYYDNHCNLIDTAKALFVHRNTVVYRLEKAEKLLGRKLKDAQTAFGYRVAFAMEDVLKAD